MFCVIWVIRNIRDSILPVCTPWLSQWALFIPISHLVVSCNTICRQEPENPLSYLWYWFKKINDWCYLVQSHHIPRGQLEVKYIQRLANFFYVKIIPLEHPLRKGKQNACCLPDSIITRIITKNLKCLYIPAISYMVEKSYALYIIRLERTILSCSKNMLPYNDYRTILLFFIFCFIIAHISRSILAHLQSEFRCLVLFQNSVLRFLFLSNWEKVKLWDNHDMAYSKP